MKILQNLSYNQTKAFYYIKSSKFPEKCIILPVILLFHFYFKYVTFRSLCVLQCRVDCGDFVKSLLKKLSHTYCNVNSIRVC